MNEVVTEADLKGELFRCCGQGGLEPIGCPQCGRPMVFCSECETLYQDLADTSDLSADVNSFDSERPRFHCPACGFAFPYLFPDGGYPTTREEWIAAGFAHLLCTSEPPR